MPSNLWVISRLVLPCINSKIVVLVTAETRYTLDRRGTATAQVRGEVGIRLRAEAGAGAAERCRWWLYETPGADRLLIEQWAGTYRVLRGKKVNPGMIELLPGS